MVPLLDVQVEQLDARTALVTFVGEHDLTTADAVRELLGSLIGGTTSSSPTSRRRSSSTPACCRRSFTLTAKPSARDTHFACNSGPHRSFAAPSRSRACMTCSTSLPTRGSARGSSEVDVPPFRTTLSHDPAQLRGLRRALASWFESDGVPPHCRDPITLATHEAAANAITHGDRDRPVNVTVTHQVKASR